MTANVFTARIHEAGFTVASFCKYWRISERTYRRYCANESLHDKLNKMIEGLKP